MILVYTFLIMFLSSIILMSYLNQLTAKSRKEMNKVAKQKKARKTLAMSHEHLMDEQLLAESA
ncbi:MAG: hypothetical protein JWR18_412 [Segetibacter sp.]|jgi:hypothetical protein|nr:hypothetical protein [Segetibacter sp.]